MSDTTNPHELLAQYDKARKIATYFFYTDQTVEDPATYTVDERAALGVAAGTATRPSVAVLHLAKKLLAETHELNGVLQALIKIETTS